MTMSAISSNSVDEPPRKKEDVSTTTGGDLSSDKSHVFLDIQVGSIPYGRIVIELFWEKAPRTCENFYQLCVGTQRSGRNLTYKGTSIHKIFPNLLIQGGDVINKHGCGGESIYGPTFEVESFETKLEAGVIAMTSKDKSSNSSQFFICLRDCHHLQDSHVGFGIVRKNLQLLEEIGNLPHNNENEPLKRILIVDSGSLPKNPQNWNFYENDGLDKYPPYPEEFDVPNSSMNWLEVIKNIKDQGNIHYKERNYEAAMRKYNKVLRYSPWATRINEAKSEDCNELSVYALLNMAASENNCKNFRAARQFCSKALLISQECAKAYFRRGQANLGLHDYDAALDDLNAALKLEPSNSRIRQEIERVKKTKHNSKNAEIQRYATIFNNNM